MTPDDLRAWYRNRYGHELGHGPRDPIHPEEVGGEVVTCEECGEIRPTIDGLCADCLRAEICCTNQWAAARALCGCGGWAAEALRQLQEAAS